MISDTLLKKLDENIKLREFVTETLAYTLYIQLNEDYWPEILEEDISSFDQTKFKAAQQFFRRATQRFESDQFAGLPNELPADSPPATLQPAQEMLTTQEIEEAENAPQYKDFSALPDEWQDAAHQLYILTGWIPYVQEGTLDSKGTKGPLLRLSKIQETSNKPELAFEQLKTILSLWNVNAVLGKKPRLDGTTEFVLSVGVKHLTPFHSTYHFESEDYLTPKDIQEEKLSQLKEQVYSLLFWSAEKPELTAEQFFTKCLINQKQHEKIKKEMADSDSLLFDTNLGITPLKKRYSTGDIPTEVDKGSDVPTLIRSRTTPNLTK